MHRTLVVLSLVACNGGGATSGVGGEIWYGSPGGAIFRYDVNGGDATQIREGSTPEPIDGGEILFVDDSDLFADATIAVGGADGATKTDLFVPDLGVSAWRPTAAFDPERIAFTYYMRGMTHVMSPIDGTLVVDRTGAVQEELPGVFDPAWAPDGTIVAAGTVEVAAENPATPVAPGLYVSTGGAAPMRLDDGLDEPMHPAVSPDGDTIAFSLNGDIWTMPFAGGAPTQITTGSKVETHPAWSPDGSKIACVSYGVFEASDYSALAIVDAAPSAPIELANDADVWPTEDDFATSSTLGRLNAWLRPTWK